MDRGIVQTTIDTCKTFTTYVAFRCASVVGLLTYSFFFGSIQQELIIGVIVLCLMDMVTGIMASVKTGQSIESRRLLKTAIKLFVYLMMISAGHLTETIVNFDFKADEIIMAVLAVTELISILENASRMGYKIPKLLLNELKDFRSKK